MTSILLFSLIGCLNESQDAFVLEDEDGAIVGEDTAAGDPEWEVTAKAESPCPTGTVTGAWQPFAVTAGNSYWFTVATAPSATGSNYWQYINNSAVPSVGSFVFYTCTSNLHTSCASSAPSDTMTYNYKQHTFTTTAAQPYPVGKLTVTTSGTAYVRACYK